MTDKNNKSVKNSGISFKKFRSNSALVIIIFFTLLALFLLMGHFFKEIEFELVAVSSSAFIALTYFIITVFLSKKSQDLLEKINENLSRMNEKLDSMDKKLDNLNDK